MYSKKGLVIICLVIFSALLITGCLPTTNVITPEEYFTFDSATGTITDYDIAGGLNVVIPSTIGGVAVEQHVAGTFVLQMTNAGADFHL